MIRKTAFVSFFMLISFSLFSQEVEVLDEIVVTATKTDRKVLEVPARVELLPAYMLKIHNIFMVDDILSQVSGVNVSRTEGVYAKKSTVSVRGMGSDQGRTLILTDGIPLNKLSTGSVNWNMINPYTVSSIEVVKGPGSSLYGGNAMGGTVNIITRSPEQGVHGYAAFDYGTYNTLTGNAGMTVRKGSVYGGINGMYRQGNGFNPYPKELQNEETIAAGVEEYQAGGYIGWDIDRNNNVQVNLSRYDGTRGTGDRIFYGDSIIDATGRYRDNEIRFRYKGKSGASNWEVAAFYLGEEMNETKYKSKQLYDIVADRKDWGVWLNYGYDINGKVRLMSGLEYKGGLVDGRDIYRTSTDMVINRGKSKTFAGFVQAEIDPFGGKLTFMPSLRYDLSRFYDAAYEILLPTSATSSLVQFTSGELADQAKWQGAFSPKLAMQYGIARHTRIYASMSSGWRPGSLEDMCRFGIKKTGFIVANPNLSPERIYTYELGGDVEITMGLSLSASGYYSDGHDFIYSVSTGRKFMDGKKEKDELKVSNIAGVEIYGGEVNAVYSNFLLTGLDVFANYTYTHASIKEYSKTQETDEDLTGKFLTCTPRHQVASGASLRNRYFHASITYRYTGSQYMTDNNSTQEEDMIVAHGLVDIRAGYTFRNWVTLSAGVNNLTNKVFLTSSDQVGMGRFLYTKLDFRF